MGKQGIIWTIECDRKESRHNFVANIFGKFEIIVDESIGEYFF